MSNEYVKKKAELSKLEKQIGKETTTGVLHDVSNKTLCATITEKLEEFASTVADDNVLTHREALKLIVCADEIETQWYEILGQEVPR